MISQEELDKLKSKAEDVIKEVDKLEAEMLTSVTEARASAIKLRLNELRCQSFRDLAYLQKQVG